MNNSSDHDVSLPDIVDAKEYIARNIIGGSSRKSIKKLYNPNTDEVNPSRFLDDRNPIELSVNRISTLSLEKTHQLGLTLTEEINNNNSTAKPLSYHGYAQLTKRQCLDAGCVDVLKEDYNGTKPYHANIIYPREQSRKADDMEIANNLAFVAELIRYDETDLK